MKALAVNNDKSSYETSHIYVFIQEIKICQRKAVVSEFQTVGHVTANDLSFYLVFVLRTIRLSCLVERIA